MRDHEEILIALRRITRAIDIQSRRLLKSTGLTTSQLLILQAIEKLSNPTPSAVAKEVLLAQATVTTIVDRMVSHGLVTRERGTTDRRTVTILLTEDAREKLAQAPELLQAGFRREYSKLPDWQRHMLVASLQHIAELMDASEIDASPILVTGDLGKANNAN
ncbi:MAG: transcriptional regulator [Gammaproteobacteria bacterium]|nr:transcriptional regulator [Gammaproteobacteria bacterium]|tara:strand:+ start:337 stop:822 length:486 start_codon:yes stop_codon:yes gene_type:complete